MHNRQRMAWNGICGLIQFERREMCQKICHAWAIARKWLRLFKKICLFCQDWPIDVEELALILSILSNLWATEMVDFQSFVVFERNSIFLKAFLHEILIFLFEFVQLLFSQALNHPKLKCNLLFSNIFFMHFWCLQESFRRAIKFMQEL